MDLENILQFIGVLAAAVAAVAALASVYITKKIYAEKRHEGRPIFRLKQNPGFNGEPVGSSYPFDVPMLNYGHLDEVFIRISGETHYLWRTIDQGGDANIGDGVFMPVLCRNLVLAIQPVSYTAAQLWASL